MSKGLEALKEIKYMLEAPYTSSVIKQGLDIIEAELKALEIIREKKVNLSAFYVCDNLIYCKTDCGFIELTQEEYDLLKEVLK